VMRVEPGLKLGRARGDKDLDAVLVPLHKPQPRGLIGQVLTYSSAPRPRCGN
jgi:hypothetical protein